jgi:hypothetical protein
MATARADILILRNEKADDPALEFIVFADIVECTMKIIRSSFR